MNNDDFRVLVSGGSRHRWVSMCTVWPCIQNDWASRAVYLHQILHSAWPFLCGNYLDDSGGRSHGQLVIGSFIKTTCPIMHHISCRGFWQNISHPGDSAPLQPRFGALGLLAFLKTKSTFEREEISYCWWDSGKYNRAVDGNWEHCVRSQGAYFEGDWGIIVLCAMFLVSLSSSINVSIFDTAWLGTFWQTLYIQVLT